MNKGKLYGLLSALALFLLFYLVFTNQTLVFKSFEVQMETEDALTGEKSSGVHYASLSCVLDGRCILTLWGWLKLFSYFILIPFVVFYFVKERVNKKIRQKESEKPL